MKDLDWVHLACKGLPYGDRDQTLRIDDEHTKALQNPKWSKLFLEPFEGRELSENKMQWLNLASRLWPVLKGLSFTNTMYTHFIVIMLFLRLLFSFWYLSYFWFKSFDKSPSEDPTITRFSLGDILSKP